MLFPITVKKRYQHMKNLDELKYPIGHYNFSSQISDSMIAAWIEEINSLPVKLRESVNGLSDKQLKF